MASAKVAHILDRMVRKFEMRANLDETDRAALYRLPFEIRDVPANRYIAREGDRPPGATLIISGLAYRHKVTVDGARQILSVHIPGDFVDLEGSLLRIADHNVQSLTQCEIAIVPRAALVRLIEQHAKLAHAMWVDTLIDGSIFREWIVNVGRRDARAGMCHLLCEFARRLKAAGMAEDGGYELPMTQEQLADDREGLIVRNKRFVRVPSWEALRKVAGFNENYLHLDQAALPAAGGPNYQQMSA
jgi:CRP-like cAMP-binding protein